MRSPEALGMKLETLDPDKLRDSHFAGIRRYLGGAVGAGAVEVPAVTKSGRALDIALSLIHVDRNVESTRPGGHP